MTSMQLSGATKAIGLGCIVSLAAMTIVNAAPALAKCVPGTTVHGKCTQEPPPPPPPPPKG